MIKQKFYNQRWVGGTILVLAFLFLAWSGTAWALDPLVPCGGTGADGKPNFCQTCDILKLVKNLFDFLFYYLMPVAATLLFLYAGFLILLGGMDPGTVQKGYKVFRNTGWGLLVLLTAWLIVNTTLRTIAGDNNVATNWWQLECKDEPVDAIGNPGGGNNPASSSFHFGGGSSGGGGATGSWGIYITNYINFEAPVNRPFNKILTVDSTAKAPTTWKVTSGSLPDGLALNQSTGAITGTPTKVGTYKFTIQVEDAATPKVQGDKEFTATVIAGGSVGGKVCTYSNANLCQASGSCPAASCNQYGTAIKSAASKISISGVNPEALIRAIMFNESSCNVGAKSNSNPPSCGLMQLQPATANTLKSRCGVTANITCDWLRQPANAEASICIGAYYLQSLAGGTCGSSVRNIAAGYNGGEGACAASRDCATAKSCDNKAVQRWECLYNDTAHQVCNTGFDETRNYAPKVLGCYNSNNGR